jgi:hypothetical protein
MTTEQRAIERLKNHVFDVLSTNYGVPARVLNVALDEAIRRVEAERAHAQATAHDSAPTCARCGATLNNVAPGYSIVAGGACVCAHCLRPGEEMMRVKRLV